MGNLSQEEATQVWIAATEHSHMAVRLAHYQQVADKSGSNQDDKRAMRAQGELEVARQALKRLLDRHVGDNR